MTTICILGGGFGGLYTALRLQQLDWGSVQRKIILVDKSDRFVFTPLLYELLTGEMTAWEVAPTFQDLLQGTNIEFRQGTVESIDLTSQSVQVSGYEPINYDKLVLSLGGETPIGNTPGVAEHTIPFRNLNDVNRLEGRLRQLETSDAEKIRVAIVGAGFSGVELACKLADRLGDRGRIRLVELGTKILPAAVEFNQTAAQAALSERKVWIDLETSVKEVTATELAMEYREQVDRIPVDVVLWTVGNQANPVVASLVFERNLRGQIKTLPTLQTVDRPEVYALGDLAEVTDRDGNKIPATAQSALQQADFAAWNIWSQTLHKPLLPFRYTNLGEMMALGNNSATLSGLGLQLDGTAAYLARRLVYLYRLPTLNHQIQVGLHWIGQPIAQLLSKVGTKA
jgi:demethylphylloquinone reductase